MAIIPKRFIDKLREDADIVRYIDASGVTLKKDGTEHSALCPFHSEKSPSFKVSETKKFFFCFGCGASGDVFDFAIQHSGLDFPEAVTEVAEFMGVAVPKVEKPLTDEDKEIEVIFEILDAARIHYVKALESSPHALEYLHNRGINDETIKQFSIGYVPKNSSFIKNSLKKHPLSLLEKAGLINKSSQNEAQLVDWTYDRIIFPIRNKAGNTIAFGGRTMDPEIAKKGYKYINTKETIVFKKGNEAYGLYEHSKNIRKLDTVVVTEGYLDVIVPSQHGVNNTVCSMGTAITKKAIENLFRISKNIIFCFDGDKAGKKAALRAMEIIIPNITVHNTARFCFLQDGMDPDDFVRQKSGAEFKEILSKSLTLSEFIIEEYSSRNNLGTAEGRARFAVDTLSVVSEITIPFLRLVVSDEIRKVIGGHIPLPVTGTLTPAPEKKVRRGFRNYSSTDELVKPTPYVASTNNSLQATLSLRVLALLIAEPQAALYFEPHWLTLVNADENEINAVRNLIGFVKGNISGKISSEAVFSNFQQHADENLISKVIEARNGEITHDIIGQVTEIINFLSDQQSKMTIISSMLKKQVSA